MSQHLALKIRNEQTRSWVVKIIDRPWAVETTSPGSPADQLPPLGILSVNVFEGEEIVLLHDGLTIRKGGNQ